MPMRPLDPSEHRVKERALERAPTGIRETRQGTQARGEGKEVTRAARPGEADRQTLSPEDRKQLAELLKHRPLQFCLFLSALFDHKQMEMMIASAIRNARMTAIQSDAPERP